MQENQDIVPLFFWIFLVSFFGFSLLIFIYLFVKELFFLRWEKEAYKILLEEFKDERLEK